jgi:hypothetical protein
VASEEDFSCSSALGAMRERLSYATLLLQEEVVAKPFRINELLPKMREVMQRVKMNDIPRIPTEFVGSNSAGVSNTSAASMGSGYSTLTSSSDGSSMTVL